MEKTLKQVQGDMDSCVLLEIPNQVRNDIDLFVQVNFHGALNKGITI